MDFYPHQSYIAATFRIIDLFRPAFPPTKVPLMAKKLLGQMREAPRTQYVALRTEDASINWAKHTIPFRHQRHPDTWA